MCCQTVKEKLYNANGEMELCSLSPDCCTWIHESDNVNEMHLSDNTSIKTVTLMMFVIQFLVVFIEKIKMGLKLLVSFTDITISFFLFFFYWICSCSS